MRYGELTAFEERPHSPYYGSADATPLFVVLLDEYERWTGDTQARARAGARGARGAATGSTSTPTCMGNGYVSYQRRNEETGLENQCWKDSWDSISYRDGTAARLPARDLRAAGLRLRRQDARRPPGARRSGRTRRSPTRLEQQAADLKRRFNRDFWVEDGEYFALALDADGSQVDALTSNIGHLLWSGIVDKSKAKAVVAPPDGRRACSPAGACARWPRARAATTRSATTSARSGRSTTRSSPGACAATASRTEAARDRRRHPRRGRVLRRPAARGVRRLRARADAATRCSTRPRAARRPGRPARRCCFLRTMLGLEPVGDHLIVDPALPQAIGRLELLDIPGRWGRIDAFGRGRVDDPALVRPTARAGRGGRRRHGTAAIATFGARARLGRLRWRGG